MIVKLVENESALTKELAYILSTKLYNLKNFINAMMGCKINTAKNSPNSFLLLYIII